MMHVFGRSLLPNLVFFYIIFVADNVINNCGINTFYKNSFIKF